MSRATYMTISSICTHMNISKSIKFTVNFDVNLNLNYSGYIECNYSSYFSCNITLFGEVGKNK
jgi:hypothetical protein